MDRTYMVRKIDNVFKERCECKSQEQRTPAFQRMAAAIKTRYGGLAALPAPLKQRFLDGSRPLMKYTNILTFNTRAICIYATCLLDCPYVYLLIEITVMNILFFYMRSRHERLSAACEAML